MFRVRFSKSINSFNFKTNIHRIKKYFLLDIYILIMNIILIIKNPNFAYTITINRHTKKK